MTTQTVFFPIYLLHYKYFLASVMGFAPGLTGASD